MYFKASSKRNSTVTDEIELTFCVTLHFNCNYHIDELSNCFKHEIKSSRNQNEKIQLIILTSNMQLLDFCARLNVEGYRRS